MMHFLDFKHRLDDDVLLGFADVQEIFDWARIEWANGA
jgi:hypothetical protein